MGYLKTTCGRSRGIPLGMAPERIVIGAVVRVLEGGSEVVECFNPATNICPLIGESKLAGLFQSGLASLLTELDQVTLADVTREGDTLRDRLTLV
tara:strand:+ start:423 stop:707 length:285 start_codon:yes stop_codon:yes gene_type:complete